MEPTGFFAIYIDDPGQKHASGVGARASDGGLEGTGSAHAFHLGWMDGAPYVTDLGSAGQILVNSVPIEPHKPVTIQVGDRITIGNTHLTWHLGASQPKALSPKVTVELPRVLEEPAFPAKGSDQSSAPGRPQDAAEAPSPKVTAVLPRVAAAPPPPTPVGPEVVDEPPEPARPAKAEPEPQEATVVASKQVVKPPAPGISEPVPPSAEGAEPPGSQAADETLLASKPVSVQASDELPPPIPAVPEAVAESPPPTQFVPKVVPGPAGDEPPPPAPLEPKPDPGRAGDEPPAPTQLVPKVGPGPVGDEPAGPGTPDHELEAPADATFTYKTAWVDVAQLLEEETDPEFESTTILRDTQTPRLVIYVSGRTWEAQFEKEWMTVGRGEGNDIAIPDESVSRHHASIERRGDNYVIREAQSTNGIWLGKKRVEEHTLREGDVLSLGRAKLAFQAGFTSNDLTLIGTPRIDGTPARRPVVFVPGLMGSQMWLGSECLWPTTRTILSNPEALSLPGDPRIEARGIVNEVVIVPNIVELRQYSGLGDYLEEGLGYTRGKDLLEFSYDWRQDVRLSAQRLAEAIESWQPKAPITIIGHSLGTLVTRYYVEKLGGKQRTERIILMGGPHYGTPKGLAAILTGPAMLPFGLGAERMRAVLSTFPSAYQILPIYPCVTDQDGKNIDLMKDTSWLPEQQRPYLGAARSFRRELGEFSSVPCVSVFGYGLKTQLRLNVHRQSSGAWQKVEFVEDTAGDQSVRAGSAVLKDSEIHPVFQEHGSLYVDDSVRMRLKIELTRSTTWQGRK